MRAPTADRMSETSRRRIGSTSEKEGIAVAWRNVVLAVFGAWFVVAAWILGLQANGHYHLPCAALGALVFLGALWGIWNPKPIAWRHWLLAVFGAWLGLSPWLADYTTHTAALWVNVIVGALTVALSVWVAVGEEEVAGDLTPHAERQAS
jgi:predicted phage tail protein